MGGALTVRRVDVAIALACVAVGVQLVLLTEVTSNGELPLTLAVGAQVVGSAAVLWRRQMPWLVFVVTLLLCSITFVIGMVPAAHAVGTYVPRSRRADATLGLVLVGAAALWFVVENDRSAIEIADLAAVALSCWYVGRAGIVAEDRAARIRTDAMTRAEGFVAQVREEEQDRLAREMHDVIAHNISLVALEATLLEAQPERASVPPAARRIGAAARRALDEMREVLGAIEREPGGQERYLRHSLREIDDMVKSARAVGQPCTVTLTAQARPDPDLAERTAVRVVREALTNAVRHAPGAQTDVSIDESGGELRVMVRTAAPGGPAENITGTGRGLQSLRERVSLVHGVTTIGPTPDGGFLVEAILPRPPA